MPSALVCPDKFRGTLTAPDAAEAMARGMRTAEFDEVRVVPLADGGEGTLGALHAARRFTSSGNRHRAARRIPVDAEWALLPGGVAVVEMARASGLALAPRVRDPLRSSTRGTGELIAAAIRAGARRVIVGVGGSATTDGGLAALEALGWSFGGVPVSVACDVTTPFLDAARVFAPQKGASDAQVALLTRRLASLAETSTSSAPASTCARSSGAGAAGGLAGGLAAIGARLEPGFEVVAQVAGLDGALDGVDLVVTGEGRLDATSFAGKVVGGVLEWSADAGVPHVAVIAGQVTADAREEMAVHGRCAGPRA